MELYVRGVTFVSVVALSYFFTYKANAAIGVCDIPAGSSPLAGRNQPPVRFTFTTIQGDPDFIFDPLNIEDHFIIVKSSCIMTLYVKSANIPRDPLPSGTKVAGQPLACESQSSEKLQVTGFVLKYMGQEIADRRAEVPESWYQGNRMVQEIRFYSFPETSPVTIRCGVRQTVQVLGNVAVYAEATITRIGCPKTSYGNRCEKECPCKNGGYCHTFESTCFCPKDYEGNTCEISLAWSASPNNTTVTPPPPPANTSRRTEESDPNAVEDDSPGGSAVRLLSGCSFLLCGTILQIIISSR